GAAQRAVAQLAKEALPRVAALDLADLAVRAALDAGDLASAESWVERARVDGGKELAFRAALVAAEVAAARGDADALATELAEGRQALAQPAIAWRWYRLQARRATASGAEGQADLLEALRRCRRVLGPGDAAVLWDDVASARLGSG